jgi:hypothetical protein
LGACPVIVNRFSGFPQPSTRFPQYLWVEIKGHRIYTAFDFAKLHSDLAE